MKGRVAWILIGLFVAILGSASILGMAKDTLVVAVMAPPRTMNPHGSDADCNLQIMANIFDGLLQRDADGNLLPALATSWERVDALTWRFHLRQGVKFHNGNDFTWEDVKFSLERLKEPYPVSEFLAFGGAIAEVRPVDGDPWTIDIVTTKPVPWFVQNLHQIFIMDKESTETRSIGEIGEYPIGTGPYKFVEWVKGSYLKLEANEDYWGGPPPIKYVVFKPITESSTRVAALISGEVDLIQDVPVELFDMVKSSPNAEIITRPSRRSIWLGLRNSPGFPGSDVRVRKAIYMAINEDEIIEKVMMGHAFPCSQIPDPPTVGYDASIERLPYDPEEAKRLLAEAGYPDGFTIKLTGPNDRYVQDEQIAQAVATQLAKVGIRVELDIKPKAIFFPEIDQHGLDFYLIGWFDGSYDFGRSFTKLLHTVDPERGYGGLNGASYSDPVLDKLLEASSSIVDPTLRADALRLLNRVAMQEKIAVIPLHYQEDTYALYKPSNVQFQPRPDGWIVCKDISFGE